MCSVIIVFSWWIRNSGALKENLTVYANKLDTSHWKHSRVTNQHSNKPTAAEHWSCKPQNGEGKTKMSSGRQQCTRLHGAQPTHRKPADLFLTPKSSHVFAGSLLLMLCQISCKNWYPNDRSGFGSGYLAPCCLLLSFRSFVHALLSSITMAKKLLIFSASVGWGEEERGRRKKELCKCDIYGSRLWSFFQKTEVSPSYRLCDDKFMQKKKKKKVIGRPGFKYCAQKLQQQQGWGADGDFLFWPLHSSVFA